MIAETWYAAASWGIGGNGEDISPLYKDRTAALRELEKRWAKQILANAGVQLSNASLAARTREEAQEALTEYLEEQNDD